MVATAVMLLTTAACENGILLADENPSTENNDSTDNSTANNGSTANNDSTANNGSSGNNDSTTTTWTITKADSALMAQLPTLYVNSLPTEGTLVNGHLLMLYLTVGGTDGQGGDGGGVSDGGDGGVNDGGDGGVSSFTVVGSSQLKGEGAAIALLMSTHEWGSLVSARNTSKPTMAQDSVAAYREDSLTTWSIPTEQVARLLRDAYHDTSLTDLNSMLAAAGLNTVRATDSNGKNYRFLCDDAQRTFAWQPTSSVLDAGTTVKTYRLRAVSLVTLRLRKNIIIKF